MLCLFEIPIKQIDKLRGKRPSTSFLSSVRLLEFSLQLLFTVKLRNHIFKTNTDKTALNNWFRKKVTEMNKITFHHNGYHFIKKFS
jgi:hypothetical protein